MVYDIRLVFDIVFNSLQVMVLKNSRSIFLFTLNRFQQQNVPARTCAVRDNNLLLSRVHDDTAISNS